MLLPTSLLEVNSFYMELLWMHGLYSRQYEARSRIIKPLNSDQLPNVVRTLPGFDGRNMLRTFQVKEHYSWGLYLDHY